MAIESTQFALFVLGTITLFWALRRSRVAQKTLLLVLSYWFYAQISVIFAGLLAGSTAVNHLIASQLKPDQTSGRRWMQLGIVLNLLFLGVFKYYDFFRVSFEGLFASAGMSVHLPFVRLLLPVGISFYTFQAIAYLVEIQRDTGPRARNLLDFALFQSFFLQLLSGPICRGRELLPQLEAMAPARVDINRASGLILGGLFKHMVLSPMLFEWGTADSFHNPEGFSAAALWLSMIGYTIQIYCDFSGYTSIMLGIALLMGIELPDNFNRPYVATSVGEFWRRWHLTFSNWLRDFIYFPLGGSHCSRTRTYLNLFATMFFCGLWHGASSGYIIWGTMHGLALVLYKFRLDEQRARGVDPKAAPSPWHRAVAGWLWTMWVVSFSRIFFVSSDLATAGAFIRRMFNVTATGDGISVMVVLAILAGFALNFSGHKANALWDRWMDRMPLPARACAWGVALLFLLAIRPGGQSPNAYFGF